MIKIFKLFSKHFDKNSVKLFSKRLINLFNKISVFSVSE